MRGAPTRVRRPALALAAAALAVAAARAGHSLWTFDTDFERFHAVLPELSRYEPS